MHPMVLKYAEVMRFNEGKSKRTVDAYASDLMRLAGFLDDRDLLLATADDLELFTGLWLHKQGVKASGRRPYVAAVRSFYDWLRTRQLIAVNPAVNVSYPVAGRRLPSMMTLSNAEKLMWAPDFSTLAGVRDAAIIALLAGCGLRREGVSALNESCLIHTEFERTTRYLLKVTEKGDKDRTLPVPREADMLLRLYLEHPDLKAIDRSLPDGDRVLFVSMNNMMVPAHMYVGEHRRMAPKAIWELVKKHGRKAGIDEAQLHPHALRHLFGTELAEDDVDLLLRQDLMGHTDPKSTAIYTHLATRKKMAEIDRANPLNKMRTPVNDLISKLQRSK